MNLFGVMDVSASALKAERVRAEVVASNMANAETTKTADGGPYRRHHVLFSESGEGSFQSSLLAAGVAAPGSAAARLASAGMISQRGASSTVSGGVEVSGVIEDEGAPLMRFDPQHPDADTDGYVAYPDINPLTEMVDLMGATRGYGLNASAIQAEKGMLTASLELLK